MLNSIVKSNRIGVSIIVCCFNSATRLPQTLKYLSIQDIALPVPYELIIVNNGSKDNTKEIAKQEWLKNASPYSLKIVNEEQAGLSFARARGIETAQYEYIIFCDDDNWLDSGYVKTAYEIISSNDSIGALGGRSTAVSDAKIPVWFSTFQGGYAVGVQSLHSGDVTQRGYIWGSGMVFRKSVYQKIKSVGFDHLLTDRTKGLLTSGGDAEICQWFILCNYKLWYDERLHFQHFIPSNRLTVDYCERLFKSFDEANQTMSIYHAVASYKKTKNNYFLLITKFLYYTSCFLFYKKAEYKFYAEAFNVFPVSFFSPQAFKLKRIVNNLNFL